MSEDLSRPNNENKFNEANNHCASSCNVPEEQNNSYLEVIPVPSLELVPQNLTLAKTITEIVKKQGKEEIYSSHEATKTEDNKEEKKDEEHDSPESSKAVTDGVKKVMKKYVPLSRVKEVNERQLALYTYLEELIGRSPSKEISKIKLQVFYEAELKQVVNPHGRMLYDLKHLCEKNYFSILGCKGKRYKQRWIIAKGEAHYPMEFRQIRNTPIMQLLSKEYRLNETELVVLFMIYQQPEDMHFYYFKDVLNINEISYMRCISRLETLKLLKRVTKGKSIISSNTYIVTLPKIEENA